MSYEEASRFSGYLGGQAGQHTANPMMQHIGATYYNEPPARTVEKDVSFFHGEALARDYWAERYGPWIVLAFSGAFSLFLLGMVLLGQTPGKSFSLKGTSDILQFVGEGLGFIFCTAHRPAPA